MSIHPDPAFFAARPAGPSPEAASVPQPFTPDEPRHDGWTARRQAQFLRELAATQSVTRAARAAGMSRQSAYKLRARLAGQPFAAAWQAAFACSFDALAHAAMERAIHGTEVPHYHGGELVGTHRRFDERLTLGLLALRGKLAPSQGLRMTGAVDLRQDDFSEMVALVAAGAEDWDDAAALFEEERIAGDPGDDAERADDADAAADHGARLDNGCEDAGEDDFDDECDTLYDPEQAMAALRADGIVPPPGDEEPPAITDADAGPAPEPVPAPDVKPEPDLEPEPYAAPQPADKPAPARAPAPAYYLADPMAAQAPAPAARGPSVRLP